jgi:uncharacterized protein (UPF0333 family)
LACASWNEISNEWEEDCSFQGEENGFYVLQTSHLTTFSVLLSGVGSGGGSGTPITISTFGYNASDFTAATEYFGASNLDYYGNLVSSFTALDDIPTEAFDTSNEVYEILQYSYVSSENHFDQLYSWLSLAFVVVALLCILVAVIIIQTLYTVKNWKKKRSMRIVMQTEAPSLTPNSNRTL